MTHTHAPLSEPELREWELDDKNDQTVTIMGRLLGRSSSAKDEHNHDLVDEDGAELHAVRRTRCSACRWFDVMIFDVSTDDDEDIQYLVYTCGRTIVPGEVDRPRFLFTESPRDVVAGLVVRQNGVPNLPVASDRALAQASDRDEYINEAHSEYRIAEAIASAHVREGRARA